MLSEVRFVECIGTLSDSMIVNVILVVGHEKLTVEMQRLFGNRFTVVKIPKSGGVCALIDPIRFVPHNTRPGRRIGPWLSGTRAQVSVAHLHVWPKNRPTPWHNLRNCWRRSGGRPRPFAILMCHQVWRFDNLSHRCW